MKIQSSAVAMAADCRYASSSQTYSQTANTSKEVAATLTFSEEAKESFVKQLEDQTNPKSKDKESEARSLQSMLENIKKNKANATPVKFDEDANVTMIKKMLEILNSFKNGKRVNYDTTLLKKQMSDFRMQCNLFGDNGGNVPVFSAMSPGTPIGSASVWTRTTATDSYYAEAESVSFATKGLAYTEDGRAISFNIELSMSRSFYSESHTYSQEDYILTDPLVFNVGKDVAQISDKKYLFDLDGDGKQEQISFATGNSGFLMFDKNGNGVADDGSELFGTKSGDGFKDLAAYDEDGNGWIDENDSVFSQLKIWSKDENGRDKYVDLKTFGVGAIYLGSSDTQFHINDSSNKTQAVVQKTGFYLKEDGGAGLVQHVDIAI